MKKISSRAWFVLILTAALVLGLFIFFVQYFICADQWVTFSGSPHLYSGSNLKIGKVTDRDGTVLLDTANGRSYCDDPGVRKAFVHLLGDRDGFIHAPMLGSYADRMIGYNRFTGLYGTRIEKSDARLTISADVQKAALEAMDGRKGAVGVYNYKTGEILCAVSSPAFDPDNVPDIADDTTGAYDGVYVNRFFNALYTPGSIFKILTSTAAIEQIGDIYQQRFECSGETIIGSQHIICAGNHGKTDFSEGLARSCNCVFGNISVQLGGRTLQKYAKDAGLTQSFEIAGYQTAKGRIDLSDAGDGDVAWAGIGQYSDQINAFAFLRYMGILGGGGEAAEPYLMQSVSKNAQAVVTEEPKLTGRVVTEEAAQKIATMLHYNVVKVYGESQFPNIYVCAKSGTAEIEGKPANAMFAGFSKNEDFPLAFIVFIEGAGAGSTAAAPVAASVLQACVSQMRK